jgi:choline-glycine betaine transporter
MREFVKQIFGDMLSRRTGQRGAGMLEFVVTLPIWAMFVIAIAYFMGLSYRHLAVMTVASDCALISSQTSNGPNGTGVAMGASSAVRDAYGVDMVVGLLGGGSCNAATEGPHNVWGGAESINYQFNFPTQPYRSSWIRGLRSTTTP